jgi:hypothetical protein
VVLNDPECPAQLKDAGVGTSYSSASLRLTQSGRLICSEGISALELRYVLYDMFGRHLKTLSSLLIRDMPAAAIIEFNGYWSGLVHEIFSSLYTVVSFVAHVRTADGRVWRHKERQIRDELAQIELAATSEVLEPGK